MSQSFKSRLVNTLEALISEVERNQCEHEETHRGGVIWTICGQCGMKWADDEGGFQPYVRPAILDNADELLAKLKIPKQLKEQRLKVSLLDWLREIADQQIRKHGQHGGYTEADDWVDSLTNVELMEYEQMKAEEEGE